MSLLKRNRHNAGRRSFLKGSVGGLLSLTVGVDAQQDAAQLFRTAVELERVDQSPENISRTWLGPTYWANRLQDWRLHQGRLECLTGQAGDEGRTVGVLTRELSSGPRNSAVLSVRTGTIESGSRSGFSGFLIGVGGGKLDYRAAALAQKASGTGGGIFCVFESNGQVSFREHTDEANPLAYALLPSRAVAQSPQPRSAEEDVELRLEIVPQKGAPGYFELKLSAWDHRANTLLAGAIRSGVPEAELIGGVSLVSSALPQAEGERARPGAGPRYWFRELKTGGEIDARPERAIGPIMGTLYSLNGNALKLNAQLAPIGDTEPRSARFQYRTAGQEWRNGPVTEIGPGYTALFRMDGWDASRQWEYRIAYPADSSRPDYFNGVIRKDPGREGPLTIGLFSCVAATARNLEGGIGRPEFPGARMLGRYTPDAFLFPHRELTRSADSHKPDLLVFCGDQLYEGNPTRRDPGDEPSLDYLYKWYLWVLSFRDLTRRTPTIVLTDDHDVYHGNLWGNGGRAAPQGDQNRGGYRCTPSFVNLVQRTQCGHNPDPYDPTPVDRGIGVYYTSFKYGGVSFAVLEDRKFKTAAIQGNDLDVHEAELLGERQERFLEVWAKDWQGAEAKICLTQTLFGCLQTSPAGRPLTDFDANGYPKPGRDRAIELLREARALVLAGDQHLASIVRHGLESFTDGVVQFCGPAGGTSWTRWFEPAKLLSNAGATPHTGDFVDGFGNKMRVIAVANPKITFAEFRKYVKGRSQGIADRNLKADGYGIVRVDKKAREFIIECWPWNSDIEQPGAKQYPGWPYRLKFDHCDGRNLGKS